MSTEPRDRLLPGEIPGSDTVKSLGFWDSVHLGLYYSCFHAAGTSLTSPFTVTGFQETLFLTGCLTESEKDKTILSFSFFAKSPGTYPFIYSVWETGSHAAQANFKLTM